MSKCGLSKCGWVKCGWVKSGSLTKCSSGLPSHQLALTTVAARQPLNMALGLSITKSIAKVIFGRFGGEFG